MAEAELEVVRGIYRAFAERRFPGEAMSEDIEWKTNPDLPDADTYRGIRAVRRFFADWVAGWAEVRNDVEELIDVGDRVVVLIKDRARRHDSDAEVELMSGSVWELREGAIVRAEFFRNRDEALEAGGVSS
jgi:ketosteroid isomerase-like protein